MKSILRIPMAILAVSALFTACKKEKKLTPTTSLPPVVNTIITQAQIDTLKKHGTVINVGTTPPALSGTYLLSPFVCTFDNSRSNTAGQTFDDYVYKFSDQNTSKFTIRVDYLDVTPGGSDYGSDSTSTYISGSGNSFTIFAQTVGELSGITYKLLEVISGETATGGLADMQITNYMQSKDGDAGNNILVPVGTTRIFYDSDKFSGTSNVIILNSLQGKTQQKITLDSKSTRTKLSNF